MPYHENDMEQKTARDDFNKKTVLLIENCLEDQKAVVDCLSHHYQIVVKEDAEQIIEQTLNIEPNLILLDVELPRKNGFYAITELKKNTLTKDIPIFFLSSRRDVSDRVTGLNLGAEDYIIKPFEPLELFARVRNKIKSTSKKEKKSEVVHYPPLIMDFRNRKVLVKSEEGSERQIFLSNLEYRFLAYLVKNKGTVLSREQILNSLWGNSLNVSDREVDVYVSILKRKCPEIKDFIESIYGVGYKFERPLSA